ncbi:phosphatidylinositol transfer protein beta isoform-like [Babylonia areolata]|uniref:phosphatidylinositol transfer protein beta isoform-like n=1 Tax=Babylonia areolata TaxID=304850 RepID=UPI003FD09305
MTMEEAPGRIWEYRICLPMKVEEYHIAQLWSVAEASKNETGGGEGLEVLVNEPFDVDANQYVPPEPLIAGGQEYKKGQYTRKIYYLSSKVPGWIRVLAPKGSLSVHEEAWNAYPYCRTVISNPDYMKKNFYICIESFHAPDRGQQENVHQLPSIDLEKREVHHIDIADNSLLPRSDYKKEWDPTLYQFKSDKYPDEKRGPLSGTVGQTSQEVVKTPQGKVCGQQGSWSKTQEPVMCCYKLVRVLFKWWGLQTRVEKFIMKQEKRIFNNFHRQVFCWMDKWYGLTMEDIRKIEDDTKAELDTQRAKGEVRGITANSED